LTLEARDLDIFEHATLSVEPVIYDGPRSFPADYKVGLRDFNLIKCIGLGGFSRVYLVQKKDTAKMYALKLIDKNFIIKNKKEVIV
jgi:serum/glucocorticoid-regulated kinase 2